MPSKTVRFANLALAGNEFVARAVHPALEKLGPRERIRAEQEVMRRFLISGALAKDHR